MRKELIVCGVVLLALCWGFLYWFPPTKAVKAVVNNYNSSLGGISNVNVTIIGPYENETFTSDSMGIAGPFHLRQAYLYMVSVEWQSLRYSRSLILPEGDTVDLLVVIDAGSMTVKVCEFLVISQIIHV